MSAIKLPVTRRFSESRDYWNLADDNGFLVATNLKFDDADQIATALNMHDALVTALKYYARDPSSCVNRMAIDRPGNKNDWNAEICQDGGDVARAALAKLELAKGAKL